MIPHVKEAVKAAKATADLETVDHSVMVILSSLTRDSLSYERAVALYNSDFFKGETPEFTQAVCQALHSFFKPLGYTNVYWLTNAGPQDVDVGTST